MPHSEEQPGGAGEVADPPTGKRRARTGDHGPGSPGAHGLTSGLGVGPAALPLLLGRVVRRKDPSSQPGGSRCSPELSRGGRAQPAEGRAAAAGRDAGSEAASAWAGGEWGSRRPPPRCLALMLGGVEPRVRTSPWSFLRSKRKRQGPGRRPTHSRSPTRLLALPAFLSGVV